MTSPTGGGLGSALIQVAADVRNFARNLQRDVQRELRRINWSTATARAAAAGALAGRAFAAGFGTAARNGITGILSKFKLLLPILPLVTKGVLAVVAALKLLPVLVPAIGGLVTVMGALAAALPAIVVGGVLVAKTLTLAFKGVGEAMKAVAEGDAAALEESIKDLTPSAQAFVREVAKIKPQFDSLQKFVQESFFAPFKGAFSELANPSVIEALRAAMGGIAEDLGKAAAAVARVIGAAGRSGQLGRIFGPLERSFERILTLAPSFTRMFLGLAEAAGPFIEILSKAVVGKLGGLIDKVNAAAADGSLSKLFTDALAIMSAVGSVLVDIGSILNSVFSIFVDQGGDALGVIAELVDQVAAFFKSAEGAELLGTVRDGLLALSEILQGVLLPLLPVAAKLLSAILGPIGSLLTKLADPITKLAEALGAMLLPVIKELEPVFSQIAVELADFLVPLFQLLTDHIGQMAPVAADMAKIIGPVLVFFFKTLGDLLIQLLPLFQDLAAFLQNNQWIFLTLAGTIGAFLLILTGAVFVITKIVQLINWWRQTLVDFLQAHGLELLINLIQGVVGGLAAGAIAIATHWDSIVSTFSDAWDAIVGTVSGGADAVVGFIAAIPDRIGALVGGFFNAARRLGQAIGNGLAEIGNFASDIGQRIVGAVRNGINAIVGSINRGIAQIDSFIPGSLPRLSFFERGGIVDEPTLSILGERNKREVVLPLTDPARTAELAQQSGLIDLLRGSGAFGGTPIINVTAILDGFGVLRVVDQRIETQQRRQASELAFGTRGV